MANPNQQRPNQNQQNPNQRTPEQGRPQNQNPGQAPRNPQANQRPNQGQNR